MEVASQFSLLRRLWPERCSRAMHGNLSVQPAVRCEVDHSACGTEGVDYPASTGLADVIVPLRRRPSLGGEAVSPHSFAAIFRRQRETPPARTSGVAETSSSEDHAALFALRSAAAKPTMLRMRAPRAFEMDQGVKASRRCLRTST